MIMTNKLTVSIIGAGNIAGGFDEKKSSTSNGVFSHAGAYTKSGKFILKNIFDVDQKKAEEFKEYWSVENIVSNENDIINGYQDIISICSPDRFHFQTLKNILLNKSCKTIFVEKPLGLTLEEVDEIYQMSKDSDINIVVNFQRHFDNSYKTIKLKNEDVLTVNAYYIKGLNHIGITMINTLVMLFGSPNSVYTYNRVFNNEVSDYSYEFILYFDTFNITVKTIDKDKYNYHLFDIDILTRNGRVVFTDNGNSIMDYNISSYAYSGVKVLSDSPIKNKTKYDTSMLKTIEYLYDIENNNKLHTINTVQDSYNNHLVVDKIIASYEKEKKIQFKEKLWKR